MLWENARKINRIPGAYHLYELVMNILYPDGSAVVIRRGPAAGYQWKRYRSHQAWMAMGAYEPHVASLISRSLKPGDTFFDVGSNAGYYVLVAARSVGPGGRVIAFEPVPFNVRVIEEQVRINALSGVCSVEPCAVSDRSGALPFVVQARNANSHLLDVAAPNVKEAGQQVIEVPAITLDEYLRRTGSMPALLNMDIEGAEVAALQGAREMLNADNNPTLLISTHSADLEREVKRILRDCGYRFQNLPNFEQMVYALPGRAKGSFE
jgi:FkbM family methyltransferase